MPGHRSRTHHTVYFARAEGTTPDGHADDSFPSLVRSPCRPQGNPPGPRTLIAVISKLPRPSGQARSRPGSDSSNTALFRWCRARQRPGESARNVGETRWWRLRRLPPRASGRIVGVTHGSRRSLEPSRRNRGGDRTGKISSCLFVATRFHLVGGMCKLKTCTHKRLGRRLFQFPSSPIPSLPPSGDKIPSCRTQQVENLLPQEAGTGSSFLFPSSLPVATRFHRVGFSKLKTCCHKRLGPALPQASIWETSRWGDRS